MRADCAVSKPKGLGLRALLVGGLRRIADRIDYPGAPKAIHVSFTFEDRIGIVFRDDGHGCRLWYYGDTEYERAHTEAGPVLDANSTVWLPRHPVTIPGEWTYLGKTEDGGVLLVAPLDSPNARIALGDDPR